MYTSFVQWNALWMTLLFNCFPLIRRQKVWQHDRALQWRFTAVNSLAPVRFEGNLRQVIFKLIVVIDGWFISCKIALRWLSLELTDDKSTLVQVMAWCRQATSHYLSQCWPRSMSPHGVNRPQWVEVRYVKPLTHCGLVMPYGNIVLGQNLIR